ncbi:MAG: winged helix-turn-helix transcriptional regulator [Thermoplasmata archaeon]|nr:winged helix-turn-helix transcriptional regulator [Thermoplasmata archaeon]NIS13685.1 winged helix-turn-helix transcriptional regulator [Thermoplasmata archaeon]NIW89001.1 winged helix-turn-helix transcriptional regulator [Thermoplasmata archaeon]
MDEKDRQITRTLFENPRASYRELADATGLSVNSVHKRVQTMIDVGSIVGFHASIGPSVERYIIASALGETYTDDLETMIAEAGRDEHTRQIIVATNDYLYPQWYLRDMSELDDFIAFCKDVAQMRSPHVVFRTPMPTLGYDKVKLSGIDYRIIDSLAHDARKPEKQVAEELGISPKTVHRHIARMLKEGSIELQSIYATSPSKSTFSFFHIDLDRSADLRELSNYLRENYRPNLTAVQRIESDPYLFICNVWTQTMKELKDIRVKLENEDYIESVKVNVLYDYHVFDTWRHDLVKKRASQAARRG